MNIDRQRPDGDPKNTTSKKREIPNPIQIGKEAIIEKLQHFKNNYSDEIPETVLHGSGDYKVRKNWWQGFVGTLDLALLLDNGAIPEELKGVVSGFLEAYAGEEFGRKPLVAKADIEQANGLLDMILEKTGK